MTPTEAPKKTSSGPREDQKIYRLTKTKRDVLSALAQYFCLRTNDLTKLIYGELTKVKQISMNRTLRILLKEGYVNRIPYVDIDLMRGGATFAYGLSDKGVKFSDDMFGAKGKTFDEHSQRTLDHELEISFFHIALKAFCKKRGLHLYWQQRDLKKKTVAPDALFAITDPSKPEGQNTLYYFLEVERSKIGNYRDGEPSIIRKLGKFYEYFNTDACEKEWKTFRQFRVIVVQRNDAKRQNLLKELGEKYKHRMFWLTTEELYTTNIGGEIFATPKDFEKVGYSFLSL